jgi:hypothetical protein
VKEKNKKNCCITDGNDIRRRRPTQAHNVDELEWMAMEVVVVELGRTVQIYRADGVPD